LAWTTTPWTLPGNVALAVGEEIRYLIVKQGDEHYVLAEELAEKALDTEYEIIDIISGSDLVGLEYEPLFDVKQLKTETSYKVYPADFVSMEEGTGIVHIAVMYGEDDYQLGEKFDLPKKHTVAEDGTFNELVHEFNGQSVKESELAIIDRLRANNQLYRTQEYEHSYPFCWRCETPLLYYARNSWFVAMSKLRKELIDANKKINWAPEHIKEGRFGEWLREVKDWAFSRSRYWATPLPVWRCQECYCVEVVGSREDLTRLTRGKNKYFVLRHAHSVRNELKVLIGREEVDSKKYGLTERGKKEVAKAVQQLKKSGGIDIVLASPMERTKQTAELIAKEFGIKVQTEPRIGEIDTGEFEGGPDRDYTDYFENDIERFTKKPPKGENLAQVMARMVSAVDSLEKKYNNKRILLVSHGDPIWLLESAVRGFTQVEAIERRNKNYPDYAELRELKYARFPYNRNGDLDFHRPFVDEITFPCKICPSVAAKDTAQTSEDEKSIMRRVEDLVDVWYDSGAMPFAQVHYPFENKAKIEKGEAYPADFISEAIDQTRGWFYTLLAVSALLGKEPSFKNVISLELVLDASGQKMSKSKGNIVDPWELASEFGMDAVRWYFFTVNHPGSPKRVAEQDIKERRQKFIDTFINSCTFLMTYSSNMKAPKYIKPTSVLDRWVVAKLKEVGRKVIENMDAYNTLDAARALDSFVMDDLSNWYIRRSRKRFQQSVSKKPVTVKSRHADPLQLESLDLDKERSDASRFLAFVLSELAKLTASFVPFVSEYVWQSANKTKAKSVHWELLPDYKKLSKSDENLLQDMAKVRELASEGLRLRANASIRVRQPLETFAVAKAPSAQMQKLLSEELNVKNIADISKAKNNTEWMFSENKKTALKIKISSALETEGQAREMIRHIQKLRKTLGLNPQDKIRVSYALNSELQGKLKEWEARIAEDTNAQEVLEKKVEAGHHDAHAQYDWDAKREVDVGVDKL
jgi:isoleucyl-tRNA synthetase